MLVKPPSSRQTYGAGPEGRGDNVGNRNVRIVGSTPQGGLRIQGVVDKNGQIEARPPHASPEIEYVRRWIRSEARAVKRRCGIVRKERARVVAMKCVFRPYVGSDATNCGKLVV